MKKETVIFVMTGVCAMALSHALSMLAHAIPRFALAVALAYTPPTAVVMAPLADAAAAYDEAAFFHSNGRVSGALVSTIALSVAVAIALSATTVLHHMLGEGDYAPLVITYGTIGFAQACYTVHTLAVRLLNAADAFVAWQPPPCATAPPCTTMPLVAPPPPPPPVARTGITARLVLGLVCLAFVPRLLLVMLNVVRRVAQAVARGCDSFAALVLASQLGHVVTVFVDARRSYLSTYDGLLALLRNAHHPGLLERYAEPVPERAFVCVDERAFRRNDAAIVTRADRVLHVNEHGYLLVPTAVVAETPVHDNTWAQRQY